MNLALVIKKLAAIKTFLQARGAEVLTPTNPYEVLRFRSARATSVVYRTDGGRLTCTGESHAALDAFFSGRPWSAGHALPRKKRPTDVQALLDRDGTDCFYCIEDLGDDITVEHLVPVGGGGTNHLNNKVLAHKDCNARAGHLPLMEKLRIRDASLLRKHGLQSLMKDAA